jgi:uncharacterized protein (DUF58 family)
LTTLVPQPRLIAALVAGALLILATLLSPLVWIVVAAYHAVLLLTVIAEARRLPSPSGFTFLRSIPRPFSLGADQVVDVAIAHPEAAGLMVAMADHAPLALDAKPRVVSGVFDSNGEAVLSYHTRPPRRGSYPFSDIDLRCWRPGGWLLRQVKLHASETAAVFPDVLAVRRYQLLQRRGMRVQPGLRRARPPGTTTSFAGLRDYLPGDDVRRISWTATARRDRPVTIEVEAERGQQAVLALDCGRLMTAPAGHLTKLDHAVNAALLLAWVAQSQGDRVGMLTFSDRVHSYLAPQRTPAQISRLNNILYEATASYAEPDFGEAFAHLRYRLNRRSLIVVLTDVLDLEASADLVAHSRRLAARHLVVVVAMADPALLSAQAAAVDRPERAFEWAAAEELMAARREAFESLQRWGVLGLDVPAGQLSPALVERYLELKERALL